jgi:uncharacterized protein DUF6496
MARKKKKGGRKYSKKAQDKVHTVMREFKHGKLKGGKGRHPKVKSRKQAIAIGLSEARKAGAKVPKKKSKKKKSRR